jgi:hypothetical protein
MILYIICVYLSLLVMYVRTTVDTLHGAALCLVLTHDDKSALCQ